MWNRIKFWNLIRFQILICFLIHFLFSFFNSLFLWGLVVRSRTSICRQCRSTDDIFCNRLPSSPRRPQSSAVFTSSGRPPSSGGSWDDPAPPEPQRPNMHRGAAFFLRIYKQKRLRCSRGGAPIKYIRTSAQTQISEYAIQTSGPVLASQLNHCDFLRISE